MDDIECEVECDMEALRLRNLAENKVMLAKMLADLEGLAPPGVKPVKMPVPRKQYKKRLPQEPVEIRRNPRRATRNKTRIPVTRIRRLSSGSSTPSDASSLSEICYPGRRLAVELRDVMLEPEEKEHSQWSDFEVDDDEPTRFVKKRKSFTKLRKMPVIRPFEEVTEDDIKMVAEIYSEKVYDQVLGSSCHQCRQKTIDQKTICRSGVCVGVRGQFCGPCLRNRYGEDAQTALRNKEWICPPCRGICNCSFCRRKSGKTCTGILIHLAQEHGYKDVNSYLQSFKK